MVTKRVACLHISGKHWGKLLYFVTRVIFLQKRPRDLTLILHGRVKRENIQFFERHATQAAAPMGSN